MMNDFDHDRTREVEVLNGAFMLIRRTAMDQVGLIDDRYFMYGDDIDWCRRFRKAGWPVAFDANAEAIHYGGGTTARAPVYFYVEMQKANLQYWKKHHSRAAQIAFLASLWGARCKPLCDLFRAFDAGKILEGASGLQGRTIPRDYALADGRFTPPQ